MSKTRAEIRIRKADLAKACAKIAKKDGDRNQNLAAERILRKALEKLHPDTHRVASPKTPY